MQPNNIHDNEIDLTEVLDAIPILKISPLPRIETLPKGESSLRVEPRATPRKLQTETRKLTRIASFVENTPIELTDVVRNTVCNSEHPDPMKFRMASLDELKLEKNKKTERVKNILEKAKTLPPPIDDFRISFQKQMLAVPKPASVELEIPPEPAVRPSTQPTERKEVFKIEASYERPHHKQHIERISEPLPVQDALNDLLDKNDLIHSQLLTNIDYITKLFAEIIFNCKVRNNYRIRTHERQEISNILNNYKVLPDQLQTPSLIGTKIKLDVVQAARKWPWYFSRIFEVIEVRSMENISLLIAISEHGIRFLIHTPYQKNDPLKVYDHISWNDLTGASTGPNYTFSLQTIRNFNILLRSTQNEEIIRVIMTLWKGRK